MPKEVIYGESFELDEQITAPVVVVRWDKESGDLQICTRELSHEIPSPEEQEQDGPWSCLYGYHATLDRRATNDLIRVLRRARDQAFGRDE